MRAHHLGMTAVVALLALAGCATRPTATATPPSPPPTPAHVVATSADNGHTRTLVTGQQLAVRLDTTFWTFDPAPPQLRPVGAPVTARTTPCRPGMGCGSVTAVFDAVGTGRFTVTAHRTTCGEAMRCTGPAGIYRLTVEVR